MATTYDFDTKYFKKINRSEIRHHFLMFLEDDRLISSSPIYAKHEDTITQLDNWGKEVRCCGSVVLRNRWKWMLLHINMDQQTSSSGGYYTYRIGGLGNGSQSSECLVNIVEHSDWSNKVISHSLVLNYRKKDGDYFTYTGNVEDLYYQFYRSLKSLFVKKACERFAI